MIERPRAGAPRPDSRLAAAFPGVLAGGAALGVLVVGRALSGRPGFLEAVSDGVIRFLPLAIFEVGLSTFGALAKGLLYLGVALAVPLAGALFAVLTRRDGLGRGALLDALLFAALVLALGELLVLPVFGAGLFGFDLRGDAAALHGPLLLAALAFGGLLSGLRSSWSPTPADAATHGLARRSFLVRAFALAGGTSLVGSLLTVLLQVRSAATSSASAARPPGDIGQPPLGSDRRTPDFGPTPALTPVADFYQVSKNLVPPRIDGDAWRLVVDGLVERPMSLSLADLRQMPAQEGFRTLACISLEIVRGDRLIGNQRWRGVRVSDVLARAARRPDATWVLWEAEDGYTESLPLDVALDGETWVAYEMGGAPLSPEHGFPARVLIAGRFGMKQPKWLKRIRLSDHDEAGYWEQRGWDKDAVVRTMSRIDTPASGEAVVVGRPFTVAGIANSGDRGIERVELSPDGGSSWLAAELEEIRDPLGPLTWVRWRLDLTLPRPGATRLVVRAVDRSGSVQDGTERASLPSGSTGWHAVAVSAREG